MVFGPTATGACIAGADFVGARAAGTAGGFAGAGGGAAVRGGAATRGAGGSTSERSKSATCRLAGGGARSGRIPANWTRARCSFGVSSFVRPWATIRVSMMIMINPTIARRLLSVRIITAERASPKSKASTESLRGSANASAASRTALCSSGPIELSLSHSISPSSSCKEMACVRFGSTAARTF